MATGRAAERRTARSRSLGTLRTPSRSAALALALLTVVAPGPLAPAIITVTGGCALVEAIRAANADKEDGGCPMGDGADTIVLTDDVVLNAVEQDGGGLPTVTSEITIEGMGYSISRSAGALADFRIGSVTSMGKLTLRNTTVSGGRADPGSAGAFYNSGELRIEGSTLSDNYATVAGGAISNLGTLVISYSTLASNSVASSTGFLTAGGAIYNRGDLAVDHTTFSYNEVYHDDAAFGGALANLTGYSVVIVDSTLRDNRALAQLGVSGGVAYGGAIANFGSLTLTNATVSDNRVSGMDVYGALFTSSGGTLTNVTFSGNNGNALYSSTATPVVVTSTILADTAGPNCAGASLVIDDLNSVADDASCGSIPNGLTYFDPTLQDNGGPTETHALLAGSSAIDAAGFCPVERDQRGAPRVGACDIGAFEYLGCPELVLADQVIASVETHEECSLTLGPELVIAAPDGDATVVYGQRVTVMNGFVVESGAHLAIERDPPLMLVDPVMVEAERARRGGRLRE